MALNLVQHKVVQAFANTTSATSVSVTITGATGGNLLVCCPGWNDATRSVLSITDGTANFTQFTYGGGNNVVFTDGTRKTDVWYLPSATPGATSVTINWSNGASSGFNKEGWVFEVAGYNSATPDVGGVSSAGQVSNTLNGPTIITTTSACFIAAVTVVSDAVDQNPFIGNEFTTGGDIGATFDAACSLITTTSGSHQPKWHTAGNSSFVSSVAAFKETPPLTSTGAASGDSTAVSTNFPTSIAPKLWLRSDLGVFADAGITPASNFGNVQQWNDQSGNGNHATQTTASAQPVYVTSGLGSSSVIQFNTAASNYMNNPYIGDPGTIAAVYRINGNAGNHMTMLGGKVVGDPVAVGAYYFKASDSASPAARTYIRTTSADSNNVSWSTCTQIAPTSAWEVFTATNDGTTLKQYRNNKLCASQPTIPAAVRPIGAAFIGSGWFSSNNVDFFQGQIAEILMYDTVLTSGDMASLESYFETRYPVLATSGNYLFSCFNGIVGGVGEQFYLLQSSDGVNWGYRPCDYLTANYVVGTGSTHVVRDVHICPTKINDLYWISHTNLTGAGSATTGFDIASSPDLFQWTFAKTIGCSSITGNTSGSRTWAPDWYIGEDGSVHIFVSLSTNSDGTNKTYEVHPTTNLLTSATSWSNPSAVSGTGLPTAYIDTFVMNTYATSGTYRMWYKNESVGFVGYFSSQNLTTGYSLTTSGDWAGWGSGFEGPCVVNVGGTQYLYLDASGNGMYYATSTNGTTWSGITQINSPFTPEHGRVISIAPVNSLNTSEVIQGQFNQFHDLEWDWETYES